MIGEHVGENCAVVHSKDFNLFLFVLNLEVEEEGEGGKEGGKVGGRESGREEGREGAREGEEGRKGDHAGSWTAPAFINLWSSNMIGSFDTALVIDLPQPFVKS